MALPAQAPRPAPPARDTASATSSTRPTDREALTGFTPEDAGTEAPTAVPDAMAEFATAVNPPPGVKVEDPRNRLTDEERRKLREEFEVICRAQREGEEMSGIVPRK